MRSTAKPRRPSRTAALASMANETVLTPVTAKARPDATWDDRKRMASSSNVSPGREGLGAQFLSLAQSARTGDGGRGSIGCGGESAGRPRTDTIGPRNVRTPQGTVLG